MANIICKGRRQGFLVIYSQPSEKEEERKRRSGTTRRTRPLEVGIDVQRDLKYISKILEAEKDDEKKRRGESSTWIRKGRLEGFRAEEGGNSKND